MYKIIAYCRRGVHKPYCYTIQDRVKASKADRIIAEAAHDILNHETRSGFQGYLTVTPRGAIVRVGTGRFVVRKVKVKR